MRLTQKSCDHLHTIMTPLSDWTWQHCSRANNILFRVTKPFFLPPLPFCSTHYLSCKGSGPHETTPPLGVYIRQTMHTSAPSILQYASSAVAPCASDATLHDTVRMTETSFVTEWMKVLTYHLWIIINYSTNHLVYLVPLLFCDWGESPRAASLVPRCEHLNCSKLWGSCVWN